MNDSGKGYVVFSCLFLFLSLSFQSEAFFTSSFLFSEILQKIQSPRIVIQSKFCTYGDSVLSTLNTSSKIMLQSKFCTYGDSALSTLNTSKIMLTLYLELVPFFFH